jgi:Kef-type K+ transport system membrane component KefB
MDVLIADVIGDIALILLVSWLLGGVAKRVGQPAVVGQMIAGIMLGPSVLGRLPGHLTNRLFPHSALPSLNALAQVSIVIFMFAVGYELDRRSLRTRRRAAVLVAAAALFVPMGLGSGAAAIFKSRFEALGHAHFSHASIAFMGVAVSITALPVLAAILRERNIADSVAGVTSTTAAGIMDATAWLVLAVVVAGVAHNQGRPWPETVLLISCFAVAMLLVVRPALRWWLGRRRAVLTERLPVAMMLALGSAWVTASLGLHPVFGGFLAGLTMPGSGDNPDVDVLKPMEDVSRALLPLFFMITGLSMNVGALNGSALIVLAIVCAIASAGKVIPAYLGARLGGLGSGDSTAVAVLVNTRGLTELIALNVGLAAGLIDEQLFSVLVLMAVIMTVATGPLLTLIGVPKAPSAGRLPTDGEAPPSRLDSYAA